MQYSQEHLKTMAYAEFGGQTECIMGNWKIENTIQFVRNLEGTPINGTLFSHLVWNSASLLAALNVS